tara:strand:+ start:270 stop:425 length:156 start_codon:yes stop_codon:yes gene_type:complete
MSSIFFFLFSISIKNYLHGNKINLAFDPLADDIDDDLAYNEYKDLLDNQTQ